MRITAFLANFCMLVGYGVFIGMVGTATVAEGTKMTEPAFNRVALFDVVFLVGMGAIITTFLIGLAILGTESYQQGCFTFMRKYRIRKLIKIDQIEGRWVSIYKPYVGRRFDIYIQDEAKTKEILSWISADTGKYVKTGFAKRLNDDLEAEKRRLTFEATQAPQVIKLLKQLSLEHNIPFDADDATKISETFEGSKFPKEFGTTMGAIYAKQSH